MKIEDIYTKLHGPKNVSSLELAKVIAEEIHNGRMGMHMVKKSVPNKKQTYVCYDTAIVTDVELNNGQKFMVIVVENKKMEDMCESCGKNPKTEPHPCPYRGDINGDSETLCTCCTDCQNECCADI